MKNIQDAVTVPNLTEPFLFLYNSQNKKDNSGCGNQADSYPIVWAAELKEAGEQINLCKINFQVFRWMLQQKGSFVFLLAGPWCVNSQAAHACRLSQ